jgi:diacylglycerol O-acyltransferase / wax synthase
MPRTTRESVRSQNGAGRTTGPEEPRPKTHRRLSSVDAAFLYLERPEIPLAIASISLFDGAVPFEAFVESIDRKLALIPRYKQKVVVPPLNLGLPTWEDDPDFDIRRHIIPVRLPHPGGEAELEALAGRLLSQVMDRSRPLWDVHVVDGLKDARGALIWRVHHALADGVSGAGLLSTVLDSTPHGSHARLKEPKMHPGGQSSHPGLGGLIAGAVDSTVAGLAQAEKGLVGFAKFIFSGHMQNGLQGIGELLPELAVSVERLPFNKPCGSDRKFCWTDLGLAEAQAIRGKLGGTLNDVILTALTRALSRYVRLHGESAVNRFVRIVCPVSLRNGDRQGDLGNQISFLPVALPLDVRSPLRLMHAVTERTKIMKHAGAAGWVALAAACIAAMPTPLQALLWRGIPEVILPVSLFNLICTNVPGSPVPLYAAGRRMIASYPQVPTGWDLGVGCAVQSYDGKLCVGFIADAHAAPDIGRLRDLFRDAFDELRRAARVKPADGTQPRRAAGKSRSRARGARASRIRSRVPQSVPVVNTARRPHSAFAPPLSTRNAI